MSVGGGNTNAEEEKYERSTFIAAVRCGGERKPSAKRKCDCRTCTTHEKHMDSGERDEGERMGKHKRMTYKLNSITYDHREDVHTNVGILLRFMLMLNYYQGEGKGVNMEIRV